MSIKFSKTFGPLFLALFSLTAIVFNTYGLEEPTATLTKREMIRADDYETFSDRLTLHPFINNTVVRRMIDKGMSPEEYSIFIRKLNRNSSQYIVSIEKNDGKLQNWVPFVHTMSNGYSIYFDDKSTRDLQLKGFSPDSIMCASDFQILDDDLTCDQWLLEIEIAISNHYRLSMKVIDSLFNIPSLERRVFKAYRHAYNSDERIYDDTDSLRLPMRKLTDKQIITRIDSIISDLERRDDIKPNKYDIYARTASIFSKTLLLSDTYSYYFLVEQTSNVVYGDVYAVARLNGFNIFMGKSFAEMFSEGTDSYITVAVDHSENRIPPTNSYWFGFQITNYLYPEDPRREIRAGEELNSDLSREALRYKKRYGPFDIYD